MRRLLEQYTYGGSGLLPAEPLLFHIQEKLWSPFFSLFFPLCPSYADANVVVRGHIYAHIIVCGTC